MTAINYVRFHCADSLSNTREGRGAMPVALFVSGFVSPMPSDQGSGLDAPIVGVNKMLHMRFHCADSLAILGKAGEPCRLRCCICCICDSTLHLTKSKTYNMDYCICTVLSAFALTSIRGKKSITKKLFFGPVPDKAVQWRDLSRQLANRLLPVTKTSFSVCM